MMARHVGLRLYVRVRAIRVDRAIDDGDLHGDRSRRAQARWEGEASRALGRAKLLPCETGAARLAGRRLHVATDHVDCNLAVQPTWLGSGLGLGLVLGSGFWFGLGLGLDGHDDAFERGVAECRDARP